MHQNELVTPEHLEHFHVFSTTNITGKIASTTNFSTLTAAISFLVFRYTGRKYVSLPCFYHDKLIQRNWTISESSCMKDLLCQGCDSTPGPLPNESAEFLSVWNPLFLSSEEPKSVATALALAAKHKLNIDLVFVQSNDPLNTLTLYSSIQKHDESFVRQILRHWEHGIHLLNTQPDAKIVSLPILNKDQYESMVHSWNENDRPTIDGKFEFEDFEKRVEETPDKIAVSAGQDKLSYAELQTKANRLAHYLQSLGVGPEIVVGLYLSRSIAFVVSLVAVKKSGGAFFPLDPEHPKERKEYLISDSQVPFIITSREWEDSLPEGNYKTITLEVVESEVQTFPTHTPDHGLVSGNIAHLFYTSGSTGRPNGVMMTLNEREEKNLDAQNRRGATAGKVLFKSSIGFTLILLETFAPLKNGGEIVVVPQGKDKDTHWLINKIQQQQVQVLNLVPSMLSVLLLEDGIEKCTSLESVFTVGERLPVSVQQQFFEKLPHAKLFVFYGTTEAPATTFREILHNENYGDRVILGKPMVNKKVYLLDEFRVPVPIGVPGELFVGGSISRGYVHNATLTNERFLPNPFTEEKGDRMYQTGDLGRFLKDGSIEYLGRKDFQVQIRGIRIELGEIEARLSSHPFINEAVVVADDGSNTRTPLIAFYTCRRVEENPTDKELREHVRGALPEYMVPSRFVRLDTFPLNTSGKIDRKLLHKAEYTHLQLDTEYVPPSSKIEKALVDIWKETLDSEQIGVQDNFFHLGGNSLLSVRLCSSINEQLGKSLCVADIYENPNIAGLAKFLQAEFATKHYAVLLGGSGHGNELFFLPGINRTALVFQELAQRLDWCGPCYGIALPFPHGDKEVLTTIEELAEHCANEIRKIDPNGPYRLAGFSFGGLLAYETARCLHNNNANAHVFLFDSRHSVKKSYSRLDRLKWMIQMLSMERHRYLRYLFKKSIFRVKELLGSNAKPAHVENAEATIRGTTPINPGQFHRSFQPKPFGVKLVIFSVRDTEFSIVSGNQLKLWNDYSREEVAYYRVPTDHHNQILDEEYLDEISDCMEKSITQDPGFSAGLS